MIRLDDMKLDGADDPWSPQASKYTRCGRQHGNRHVERDIC